MNDCLGKKINVGDRVVAPARTACILHLKTGVVVGFDGKKVLIRWTKNKHRMSESADGYTTLPGTLAVLGARDLGA